MASHARPTIRPAAWVTAVIFLVKIALFLEALQLAAIVTFRASLRPRHRDVVTAMDALIVLLIPLVGLFGHSKNAFYAMLFILPLFWAADPARLARRYVFVLVMFPGLQEIYVAGGLYLGTLSAPIFFNAGALFALAVTRRGRLKPVRSIDAAIWMLFFVGLLFVARGEAVNGVLRVVVTTLLLVIPPYFVVARAVGSARAAEDTVGFIVLGGLCNAVVAIFESVKHWAMYQTFNQALGVQLPAGGAVSMRAGLLRAGGAVANYEVLGLVTGIALVAAVATRRRFTVPGFYAVILLLSGGLFVSQARSAWIATLVGLLLQALYDRQWRRVGIIATGVGLGGALALAASSGGMIGQLLGKGGHAEATTQYRQTLLVRGLEEAERHLVTGQTLSQLSVSMNDLRQGEHIIDFVNTHLYALLVGGLGGFILWLFAWAIPLVLGWGRRRFAGKAAPISVAFPFAALGMTFLYLAFTSPIDRIMSLVAIGMGLMSVCIRLSAVPAAQPRRSVSAVPGRIVAPALPVAQPGAVGAGAA